MRTAASAPLSCSAHPISPLYLAYISPISPLYLPCITPISPLYLQVRGNHDDSLLFALERREVTRALPLP